MPTPIDQFVAAKYKNRLHPNCWACQLPDADDLNAAYREGVGVSLLCSYLSEKKNLGAAEALEGKLRGHFRRGHHLDGVESS